MALERAKIWRRTVMAVKAETTTGTAIALMATEGAYNVRDPKIEQVSQVTERKAPGSMSPLPPVAGSQMGKLTFGIELYGSGTSGSSGGISTLLQACGFTDTSGLMSLTPAPQITLTMAIYQDGLYKSIKGAMGKFKLKAVAGDPIVLDFEFNGVWVAPTDVAIIAPTLPTVVPPRFASATLTLAATSYYIGNLEMDFDNQLTMRRDATAQSAFHSCQITGRRIAARLDPEATTIAAKDWFADYVASSGVALSCIVGSSTGNTQTIACPKLVQAKPPTDGDENGIYLNQLDFVATTSAALDDECTLRFA